MDIVRTIAGVVVGYLIFAAASMLMIGAVTEGQGPVAIGLGLLGLTLIGLIAGFVAMSIAGANIRLVGFVLAGLVVIATAANLILQLGAEPLWYKVGTLALTAPGILFVCLRERHRTKTE